MNCFLPPPRDFQATSNDEISSQNLKYTPTLLKQFKCHQGEMFQVVKIIPNKNWELLRNVPDFFWPLSVCLRDGMVIDNFTQLENFLNATKIPNCNSKQQKLSQSELHSMTQRLPCDASHGCTHARLVMKCVCRSFVQIFNKINVNEYFCCCQ